MQAPSSFLLDDPDHHDSLGMPYPKLSLKDPGQPRKFQSRLYIQARVGPIWLILTLRDQPFGQEPPWDTPPAILLCPFLLFSTPLIRVGLKVSVNILGRTDNLRISNSRLELPPCLLKAIYILMYIFLLHDYEYYLWGKQKIRYPAVVVEILDFAL